MTELFRARTLLRSVFGSALLLAPAPAFAAQVRGSVDAAPPAVTAQQLGYTKTRVASPIARTGQRADVAVFLAAKESGVIPPPTEPYKVSIAGLELEPNVAACVIDGKVAFTNDDRAAVTLEIEDQPIGSVAPGQSLVYECKTGEPKTRRIRVKEWPHVRGTLFVGEVGVVASIDASGAFKIQAPVGKYEVQLLGEVGPLITKAIEVKTPAGDVDVGKLVARDPSAAAEPEVKPAEERPGIEPVVAPPQPVKKDPAAVVPPVKKDPVRVAPVLPTKDQLKPAKEPGARPSEESQELDFEQ